jgi:hypothetical protein
MADSVYPPPSKILYLEQAINLHLEGQRKWICPHNNPIVNQSTELHIETIEGAPRDSASLYKRIADKKKQKEKACEVIQIQDINTEIDALERLLGMVRRCEKGESLDGLTY